MFGVKTLVLMMHRCYAMALGDFHSRLQSPTVAMYPILCDYNSTERLVLPFIFAVRKFLQLQVTLWDRDS